METTDRCRIVFKLAEEEAIRSGHRYIGPEHLLLGIIANKENTGMILLISLIEDCGGNTECLTLEYMRNSLEGLLS